MMSLGLIVGPDCGTTGQSKGRYRARTRGFIPSCCHWYQVYEALKSYVSMAMAAYGWADEAVFCNFAKMSYF